MAGPDHFSGYAGITANLHWKYFELGYSVLAGSSIPSFKDIRVSTGIGQLAVPYILSYFRGDPKLVVYGAFLGLILPESFILNIPVNDNASLQLYAQPYSAIYSNTPSDTVKKERVQTYGEAGLKFRKHINDRYAVDFSLGLFSNYNVRSTGVSLGISFNWLPKKYREAVKN